MCPFSSKNICGFHVDEIEASLQMLELRYDKKKKKKKKKKYSWWSGHGSRPQTTVRVFFSSVSHTHYYKSPLQTGKLPLLVSIFFSLTDATNKSVLLGYSRSFFFFFFFFIKESKHNTIFTSKHNGKLQKLRDKLQYLQMIGVIRKRRRKKREGKVVEKTPGYWSKLSGAQHTLRVRNPKSLSAGVQLEPAFKGPWKLILCSLVPSHDLSPTFKHSDTK